MQEFTIGSSQVSKDLFFRTVIFLTFYVRFMYYVRVLRGVRPSVSLRAGPWSYDSLCLCGSGVMTLLHLYLSCFPLIAYFGIYNCKSPTTKIDVSISSQHSEMGKHESTFITVLPLHPPPSSTIATTILTVTIMDLSRRPGVCSFS